MLNLIRTNTLLLIVFIFLGMPSVAEENKSVWRDDFTDLDRWEELTFPKIEKHTEYSVVKFVEGRTALKAEADDSASGLVSKDTFDPVETPIMRFRWRIENILRKGDAERKSGDDYPIRVYVLFTYDPDKASWGMRASYGIARRIHGEYPPHASLNYIWANRRHSSRILSSPYSDRSQMVILRVGSAKAGEWVEEEVNILADYREAFDEKSPREARLAIMSDADNTGESAVGYIEYIELLSR